MMPDMPMMKKSMGAKDMRVMHDTGKVSRGKTNKKVSSKKK